MNINPKQRLQDLLIELFQLDKTDLDFGIYRIMNLRAADVNQFINEILPAKLNEVSEKLLAKSKGESNAEAENAKVELLKLGVNENDTDEEIERKFNQFGNQVPLFKENYEIYKKAKESAHQAIQTEDLERDIYNDLFRFFDRYYEEGDFVSKPRAGESTFMIPYNGEETLFYWANHDQYYIKTGENFKNYVFTNGETDAERKTTVEFRLTEAETEVNNNQNKKGRVFLPTEDYFEWNDAARKLTLKFYYKVPDKEDKEIWGEKQSVQKDNKGINERLVFSELESKIRATGDAFLIRLFEAKREIKNGKKSESRNEFYYHLNRYTSINSFDYFIHKDLRRFLRQELDYFLKHEIFSLNFLADNWSDEQTDKAIRQNLIRATVIRDVAARIIEFLADIENFQKLLYEKKKFVVQSDYCITLDLIPDDIFDEIIEFTVNDGRKENQLAEWQKLGFTEASELNAEDIKADRFLVLDTKFLPAELKFKLLDRIENLDENCGGLLINSDNFQALNFLQNKYKEKIKCVYIDPPYNTAASEIIYKNSYKHSSWISLLENRLELAKHNLMEDGVICIAIDDFEFPSLKNLLDEVFGESNFLSNVAVRSNPHGRAMASGFQQNHEYALFYGKIENVTVGRLPRNEKKQSRYPHSDDEGKYTWLNFRTTGANSRRADRPKLFFPIYVDEDSKIRFPKIEWSEEKRAWQPTTKLKKTETIVYPVDSDGEERVWNLGSERVSKMSETDFLAKKTNNNWQIYRKYRPNEDGALPNTWWEDAKYSATDNGVRILKSMFGERENFSYPKSVFLVENCLRASNAVADSIILDFFAGSGTTGHAVINLNREDEGTRKYILVEMGEYFDTVTKPRIQKVIYSADWKNGKPVRDHKPLIETEYKSNGVSHIFQYIKLEQYEDTLNNIGFDGEREQIAPEFEFAQKIKYLLRYGTSGSPSLLAIDRFNRPFDYRMDIIRLNERTPTNIDLVTTFNFLLGIDVVRYRTTEHQNRAYAIIEGVKKKQAYLIVWRNYGDDLDLEAERDFIKQGEWFSKDALVYANADNAFGADSIEAEFKRLLTTDEHR